MKLEGKKVLITGGAIRLGRAISMAFANAGAQIIIHYNNSRREAAALLSELAGKKSGHQIIKCNLEKQNLINKMFSSLGTVDILVNNASVYHRQSLSSEDIDEAKTQFQVNFWAPLTLMREFYRKNIAGGCIINILDQSIAKIGKDDGAYVFSKKSLAEATLAAALQWAPKIRVNAIAPGAVIPPRGMEKSMMKKQLASMPMEKAPSPEDIANACIYLVEQDALTGQILYLDGGAHI